jgi:N-acetylmuramoyl-L-alanine amidase
METTRGTCSWFGGPDDTGVAPDEGLAFIYEVDDAPHLFLPEQPPGTSGLARRLDPEMFYIACRWDYDVTPKPSLLEHTALVRSPKTGRKFEAYPADWGPNENTGRVADLSPGLMDALGITTDDEVEVTYPFRQQEQGQTPMTTYSRICISSGHSSKCPGASGILDEVTEARKVVEQLAEELRDRGVTVEVFHDDVSTNVSDNLERICDWHNSKDRELDISCHFNAYVETTKPMGTEVLYVTQEALAEDLSAAIASCGFIDRGAKYRDDLYVLNNTDMPCVLLEICFVDSEADADMYREQFDTVCSALADTLGGKEGPPSERPDRPERPERPDRPERPERPDPPPQHQRMGRVDIEVSGPVRVIVNRVPMNPEKE